METRDEARRANQDTLARLVTTERVGEFFSPRSLALVGASDNSGWARLVLASNRKVGFSGPIHAVHPKADSAFGLPMVRSLTETGDPADLAFILAPPSAVDSVVDDMAAAGVRNGIVLASGFREAGEDGIDLERSLIARALKHDIVLLGPNCLGFINMHAHVGPYSLGTPPAPLPAGPVGIALQSGALTTTVMNFCRAHAIGMSTLVSLGNEAMVSAPDVVDHLVADEHTKVICLFLETIGDSGRFIASARRADEAGKPIVVVKVGASEAGQQSALAHTGAIAGDDAVVDAALGQLNVIRTGSLEEMLTVAAAAAYTKVPRGRRIGIMTGSGGGCDILADAASAEGLEIPELATETLEGIRPFIPPFVEPRNPIDLTAYDLANVKDHKGDNLKSVDRIMEVVAQDPGLDMVIYTGINLRAEEPTAAEADILTERLVWAADRIEQAPIPVYPFQLTTTDVPDYGKVLLADHDLTLLAGANETIRAIGHVVRWAERRGRVSLVPQPWAELDRSRSGTSWSEMASRGALEAAGVPVVPGGLATSADEAVALADGIGGSVALKVVSSQIAHKSDIGGVALGVDGADAVRDAYERVAAAGAAVPGATVDGVFVGSMRSGGTELFAGVTRDPTFGLVLAVGLGGVWIETLRDSALRVLPVDRDEVLAMLRSLRGFPLLQGARGTVPADLECIADVVVGIGQAALELGSSLDALEVNPLWVDGPHVEALDALVVAR